MRKNGLYDPANEHDACGVGFIARLDGRPAHDVITYGLDALKNLAHRGASGADADTGDGAGILMSVPDRLLRDTVDFIIPPLGEYAVGMVFSSNGSDADKMLLRRDVRQTLTEHGWDLLGWRDVPVHPEYLGRTALQSMPAIWQFFAKPPAGTADPGSDDLERAAYIMRRRLERAFVRSSPDDFYVCSFSFRTIVYKGMMTAAQVEKFFPDLTDTRTASPFAIVHQRYSTNTFPSWRLAHPFRCLAHNGEINTIRGNRRAMTMREPWLRSDAYGSALADLSPMLQPDSSDSANLDNACELLCRGGRGIDHTMTMLIPQAWGAKYPMGPDLRGFFEFHAGIMEPWDGPAVAVFTDGVRTGACLDRNGLRPARYCVTTDGMVVFGSEAGILPLRNANIASKGSLRPGQMILADPQKERLITDGEIKAHLARRHPYRRWVAENRIDIHGLFSEPETVEVDSARLPLHQRLFGYTLDDTKIVLEPMASRSMEGTGSMGHDAPLAVLSDKPQTLFNYFRQQFAQITNPPIDPIREELVMSLMSFLGTDPNILAEEPAQARLVKLKHPVLTQDDMGRMRALRQADLRPVTLQALFDRPAPGAAPGASLAQALAALQDAAQAAATAGTRILIISDCDADEQRWPIPALLANAAVLRRLDDIGLLARTSVIAETGEARDVHHLALLLGIGVHAVCPWLAFTTVADLARHGSLSVTQSPASACENYVHALCKGLRKIMSKMGISTLRSFRGSGVFEAVGLSDKLMEAYFPGIASRVGGIDLPEIEADSAARMDDSSDAALPGGGFWRPTRGGERHQWNPETTKLLQNAVRTNDWDAYMQFAERVNNQSHELFTLRGLLDFTPAEPVRLEDVESEEEIITRFSTGAMSFGSLSREAHTTLALAMNRIGCASNSGEGGEDPARFAPLPDGGSLCSAVKQVASGRFGVTIEYLVNAREIQIKIAQGAKPGEGGQLPGAKVNDQIAQVRHSMPGITLISPPPHHDIYSIEDIAQLIHDLKMANDKARISVKLVAEHGIGTIAAGVAKAMAGMIVVSGHDGGTGAAPLSSIRSAGAPWELGLAETQQTLMLNNLRSRVRIQVDGGLKTGRDVAIAALLGADEFSFSTAALVCMGCIMDRMCHTNTCPVGIATQDPERRKKFAGSPDHLIAYFRFIARELRQIMAGLGFRSLNDMIGRSDRLTTAQNPAARARLLDFTSMLARPGDLSAPRRAASQNPCPPEHDAGATLDDAFLPQLQEIITKGDGRIRVTGTIRNTDRTVGTRISSAIVRARGSAGLAPDSIVLDLVGSAGQSFGAFLAPGLRLDLEGEANDYVGKGLSGGCIIIRTPSDTSFAAADNIIIGNVALYGATKGEMYVNGRAGERFAVRNSGAQAVVEGIGDHGCEYMTGGVVVVLGPTGVNFAAGMSGGLAYVYDEDGFFDSRCNLDMVDLDLLDSTDLDTLKSLLVKHFNHTGSTKAKSILSRWDQTSARFVKVFPMEYRRVLGRMHSGDLATPRAEQAGY